MANNAYDELLEQIDSYILNTLAHSSLTPCEIASSLDGFLERYHISLGSIDNRLNELQLDCYVACICPEADINRSFFALRIPVEELPMFNLDDKMIDDLCDDMHLTIVDDSSDKIFLTADATDGKPILHIFEADLEIFEVDVQDEEMIADLTNAEQNEADSVDDLSPTDDEFSQDAPSDGNAFEDDLDTSGDATEYEDDDFSAAAIANAEFEEVAAMYDEEMIEASTDETAVEDNDNNEDLPRQEDVIAYAQQIYTENEQQEESTIQPAEEQTTLPSSTDDEQEVEHIDEQPAEDIVLQETPAEEYADKSAPITEEALADMPVQNQEKEESVAPDAPLEQVIAEDNEPINDQEELQNTSVESVVAPTVEETVETAIAAEETPNTEKSKKQKHRKDKEEETFAETPQKPRSAFSRADIQQDISDNPEVEERRLASMRLLGLIPNENGEYHEPQPIQEEIEEAVEEVQAPVEEEPQYNYSNVLTPQGDLEYYLQAEETEHRYSYKAILHKLFTTPVTPQEETDVDSKITMQSCTSMSDFREEMRKKGYDVRQYVVQHTVQYYSKKYINVNSIKFATSCIVYLIAVAMVLIGYFVCDRYAGIGYKPYLTAAIALLVVPGFYGVRYMAYKDKHAPATFSFKLSLATSFMVALILMMVFLLFAFFYTKSGANISDVNTLVAPVFYPAAMLMLLPISVVVYALLYRTRKFYVI